MVQKCVECLASNAYSCFSRVTLTAAAIFKVLISLSVIIIVATKLEDVIIKVDLPVDSLADLTTLSGIQNVTNSIIGGGGGASGTPAGGSPSPTPGPAPGPSPSPEAATARKPGGMDLNTTAGPVHIDAACLLQKRGATGQFESSSMCIYTYTVASISLAATFVMTGLLWCTCHLCGWGPMLEMVFAALGTVWWLVAAIVLQEHTAVAVDAGPAAIRLVYGNTLPPPPAPMASLFPPPSPPAPPGAQDLLSRVTALLVSLIPHSLVEWRRAVVGCSWAMMGLFAATAVLLLVEACGCLYDVFACCARCCCCPDRPESKWRSRMARRKKLGETGEEYVEMTSGVANSTSGGGFGPGPSGGGAPPVVVVARSDGGASDGGGFGAPLSGTQEQTGRAWKNSTRGWWRSG